MRAALKPYPAYKESGVEWLGEVPEHWTLRRTKTVLRERIERGYPDEPLLAATQTKGVVRKEQYENRTVLAFNDLHLLKLVHVGDFVISLRSFQGGIEFAHERGIISPAYTILYPEVPDMRGFLAWLFKSRPYIENLTLHVTGIRQGQNIDYQRLSRSTLPVPPLPEQAAIVRYLDYMDHRIRRYIRAKQKLIKLLEEQKQVIIHEAVTGQIDVRTGKPYPAYKDSGVEWLGQVPEHWEVRRLKSICRLAYGDALAEDAREDGITPVFGSNGRVGYHSSANTSAPCIVIGRKGSFGKVNFSYQPVFAIDTTFFVDARNSAANLRWLFYLLGLLKLDQVSRDSAVPGLAREDAYARVITVPTFEEQVAIARYLDDATANTDTAIAHARDEIELLREYRTRLIADVVTGKLDVREAAANLRDEAQEPESLTDEDLLADEDEVEDAVAEEACPEELDA
jgi:type I restriction enzyme S subunit